MKNRPLIGLYSPAPQCGKTMVAGIASEDGYVIAPFAGTIKDMVVPMLGNLGYNYPRAWEMVLRDKDAMVPELGVTVRHMLQTLGTEYGRQCLHPDVWLVCWRKQAERHAKVIADDIRFKNEADLIRSMGGKVWMVRRPFVERTTDHISEGALDNYDFDAVIDNDGTLDDLRSKVEKALNP
jgi:hypothetical protein